jgi:hypothetical protein
MNLSGTALVRGGMEMSSVGLSEPELIRVDSECAAPPYIIVFKRVYALTTLIESFLH